MKIFMNLSSMVGIFHLTWLPQNTNEKLCKYPSGERNTFHISKISFADKTFAVQQKKMSK